MPRWILTMLALFDFARSDDIPRMARPMFAVEWRHMLLWGVFAGIVEGNTSAIVVAKTFDAGPLLVTVVWTTPMLANLLTLLWGAALRGRRRLPFFLVLAAAAIVSFATVGLTPAHWKPWGGWLFAVQLALSRVFMAGLISVRTSLWNINYPQTFRARITGRLQSLRFLTGLFAGAGVSLLFNINPDYYRWVYPTIGVLGTLSLMPLMRLRVRGERADLARFRAHMAEQQTRGVSSMGMIAGMREALAILKRDKAFARYCTAQYFLGSANFMVDPVLVIILASELGMDYFSSLMMLDQGPNLVMLFTIPFWSRLFDRLGVLRFRVVNSIFWVASIALAGAGVFALSWHTVNAVLVGVALLSASRLINGLCRGGGTIAWNLGHLHFSSGHDADLYMGIHVALTGLRGIIMPFLAMQLYRYIGWWVIVVATAIGVVAVIQFQRLAAAKPVLGAGPPRGDRA